MSQHVKSDGTIEIELRGCGCPPGQHYPQHTNSCTNWWRIVHGQPMTEWRRHHKSTIWLREMAEAANDCAEFEREVTR